MSEPKQKTSKRQRRIEAKKRLKKESSVFKEIDLSLPHHQANMPKWMTRGFANNRYVILIDDNCPTTKGTAIRAMVQKTDDTIIHNHWSELQRIKNEIFGKETTAVEYYPAESELIDDHNIYWLWIFPDEVLPIPIN